MLTHLITYLARPGLTSLAAPLTTASRVFAWWIGLSRALTPVLKDANIELSVLAALEASRTVDINQAPKTAMYMASEIDDSETCGTKEGGTSTPLHSTSPQARRLHPSSPLQSSQVGSGQAGGTDGGGSSCDPQPTTAPQHVERAVQIGRVRLPVPTHVERAELVLSLCFQDCL